MNHNHEANATKTNPIGEDYTRQEDNMEKSGDCRREDRFMIVDDEPMIRTIIRRVLEKENFQVVGEASDGNEAVALAAILKPDVVIMDNMMKGMHGIEATSQIKEDNPATRVIMMTAEPKPSVVRACMEAGASNFMIKPFDMKSLLLAVRNISNANTNGGRPLLCASLS